MKAFNVRPDLKLMSEVEDEAAPKYEELPRYLISPDQANFDCLMGLLETENEELAVTIWELVDDHDQRDPLQTRSAARDRQELRRALLLGRLDQVLRPLSRLPPPLHHPDSPECARRWRRRLFQESQHSQLLAVPWEQEAAQDGQRERERKGDE